MRSRNIAGFIARIVVGLVFVASATTKYVSIDAVDLFIYEHQILSWEVTTFVTRLLISIEAFVGLMLILGIYARQIKLLSIIVLILFTSYVLLKPLLFNVDSSNCHCFGTVLLLNDTQTIIKNLILLAISSFMFWDKGANNLTYKLIRKKTKEGKIIERNKKTINGWLYCQRKFLSIFLFFILFLLSNLITLPEPIARKVFPKTASIDRTKFDMLIGRLPFDEILKEDTILIPLYQSAQDSIRQLNVTEGKKILCLYSTGCKYCKRSAIRLDVVRQRYNLPDSSIVTIFWGSNEKIDSFFTQTNTKPLPHTLVSHIPFLLATKGRQPVIALMNEGKVEKLLKYPNINEKEIIEFLNINK